MVLRIQGMFGPFLSAWEVIDQLSTTYTHIYMEHLTGSTIVPNSEASGKEPSIY
jgi:hypothetical protein